jgi:hypothetical protein
MNKDTIFNVFAIKLENLPTPISNLNPKNFYSQIK